MLILCKSSADKHNDFQIELCPCGITPTFQLGSTFEQPVTSDPTDTQVTSWVKFLKAWFGPRAPVLEEYVGLLGQKEPNGTPYGFRVELFPRAIGDVAGPEAEISASFRDSLLLLAEPTTASVLEK